MSKDFVMPKEIPEKDRKANLKRDVINLAKDMCWTAVEINSLDPDFFMGSDTYSLLRKYILEGLKKRYRESEEVFRSLVSQFDALEEADG